MTNTFLYLYYYAIILAVISFLIVDYQRKNKNKASSLFSFQVLAFCAVSTAVAMVLIKTMTFLGYELYLTLDYLSNLIVKNDEQTSNWRNGFLFLHIFFAMPTTFIGPLLFLESFRNKRPKTHRTIGKFYVFGAILSAITALPLSVTNIGGIYPRIGFTTMAILWFLAPLKEEK